MGMTKLPLSVDLESKAVLRALPGARAALAELKGVASSMPNESILINTLGLQEAKDSSAIENIITSHDDLYKSSIDLKGTSSASKEVQNYIAAMRHGYSSVTRDGFISLRTILEVQSILESNTAGFRKVPGTVLRNSQSGETIYTPPQDPQEIESLMGNLEEYINGDTAPLDPLIKMCVIHAQFERIHPFYDGNGRTGRILNILYLILQGLQSVPILYLSKYIITQKSKYYSLLQGIDREESWEPWLIYLIEGVEQMARETIRTIHDVKALMGELELELSSAYRFYRQELLNNLFSHPYTKIEFVVRDLQVSRLTAANYLNVLSADGYLKKERHGNSNYYINEPLYKLLSSR